MPQGKVYPIKKGSPIPLPGVQRITFEEMLDDAMPDGYCHVVVIGMDDEGLIGYAMSKMNNDTMLWMLEQAKAALLLEDE